MHFNCVQNPQPWSAAVLRLNLRKSDLAIVDKSSIATPKLGGLEWQRVTLLETVVAVVVGGGGAVFDVVVVGGKDEVVVVGGCRDVVGVVDVAACPGRLMSRWVLMVLMRVTRYIQGAVEVRGAQFPHRGPGRGD